MLGIVTEYTVCLGQPRTVGISLEQLYVYFVLWKGICTCTLWPMYHNIRYMNGCIQCTCTRVCKFYSYSDSHFMDLASCMDHI